MEIIKNNNWFLEIDLIGGRIKELKYGDEVVLGTFERIDGKLANTHICCPNFGNEGMEELNLPFHGPFRNMIWKLISKDKGKIEIEAVDLGLKVRQFFDLQDGFQQRVVVQNLDKKEKTVNVAVHNYWETGNGWQGTKLNNKLIDELVKSDVSKKVEEENILEISKKSKYRWDLTGFKYGQFWTGVREKDGRKEYDTKYVCVEAALEEQGFLNKGIVNLGIDGKIEVIQRISVL